MKTKLRIVSNLNSDLGELEFIVTSLWFCDRIENIFHFSIAYYISKTQFKTLAFN